MAPPVETLFEQLQDEAVACATIKRMIDEKRLESDILDYKGADQISDRDRKTHWSKALSAFANTGGGVVVWGVDCRKELDTESGLVLDRPTGKPALAINAIEFAQKLADLLANATVDVVERVRIIPVVETGPAGYVVCLIPEGRNKPYRAMYADERYMMRQPDRMATIPHALLRSLFYPRVFPLLNIDVNTMLASEGEEASIDFLVFVVNNGNATAKGLFVDVQLSDEMQVNKCLPDWWAKIARQEEPANGRVTFKAFSAMRPFHPSLSQALCRFRWVGSLATIRENRQIVLSFLVYAENTEPRNLRVAFYPSSLTTNRQQRATPVVPG